MDVAKKCAEAQRKVSLRKFTEEYMTTFRAIKVADLDVNVPKDKAYWAGSGPADYKVVFGRYDEPKNVRTTRSYVNLCPHIRTGHKPRHATFLILAIGKINLCQGRVMILLLP